MWNEWSNEVDIRQRLKPKIKLNSTSKPKHRCDLSMILSIELFKKWYRTHCFCFLILKWSNFTSNSPMNRWDTFFFFKVSDKSKNQAIYSKRFHKIFFSLFFLLYNQIQILKIFTNFSPLILTNFNRPSFSPFWTTFSGIKSLFLTIHWLNSQNSPDFLFYLPSYL